MKQGEPRFCAACGINRRAISKGTFCFDCKPGGPFTPPPCTRCGTTENFFASLSVPALRCGLDFFGHSFIADHTGDVVAQADDRSEQVITASFDLDEVRRYRHSWGVFRDRRPDLYGPLLKMDGGRG